MQKAEIDALNAPHTLSLLRCILHTTSLTFASILYRSRFRQFEHRYVLFSAEAVKDLLRQTLPRLSEAGGKEVLEVEQRGLAEGK
jgi:hypothetical protein